MDNEQIESILRRLDKLEKLESLQIDIAVIKSKLNVLQTAAYTITVTTIISLISSFIYFLTHTNFK